MSLRSVLRARFRGDKESSSHIELGNTHKNGSCENMQDASKSAEAILHDDEEEEDMSLLLNHDADTPNKEVYELQLSQLQEQLVAAMIENQNLNNELEIFRGENQVDKLLQELEYERNQVKELQAEILKRQTESGRGSLSSDGGPESQEWIDMAEEAEVLCEEETVGDLPIVSAARSRITDKWLHWVMKLMYNLMADFTEGPDEELIQVTEEEPLAVKKLKDNIKRFRHNTKPVFATVKGFQKLFTWYNPALTLIVFTVYMYAVWLGYLLPVILFLVITRLSINYLKERGWNINIVLLAGSDEEEKDSEAFKDLGMSDKFNLVLQVAKQVQNTMGRLSDNLEKVKNLLTWKHRAATLRLYIMLCVAFVLSCVLNGTMLFTFGALYFGIKMFVIQYLYVKFPRFRQRHDTTQKLWKQLPTDAQLERKYHRAAIEMSHRGGSVTPSSSRRSSSHTTAQDHVVSDHFNLPLTETPLPGWHSGRRCTLINKDKSLTSAFKNGRLYLTESYLCFERVRSMSSKNFSIALTDITKVEKANPFVWMPGSGMSIEISVVGQEKPYIFGAMLYRDECYDSIMTQGATKLCSWASGHETDGVALLKSPAHANKEDSDKHKATSPPPPPYAVAAAAAANDAANPVSPGS